MRGADVLLAVDVGNTQTVIGLYSGEQPVQTWRLASDISRTSDELEITLTELFDLKHLSLSDIDAVIIASVVPHLTTAWERLSQDLAPSHVLTVGPGMRTGINIALDNPHEVGADRIANAVGASEKYGSPVVVIDFGTATNIDVVDTQGKYLGGVISPGLETSAQALFSRAARLSAIDLEFPPKALGTNTKYAIQSGLMLGEIAKVEGLVRRIWFELGYETFVVATGGLSELMGPQCELVNQVDVDLTLDGLRFIARRHLEK